MGAEVVPLTIEIMPRFLPILESLPGETTAQKFVGLITGEFHRLEECARAILELEIKYSTSYSAFCAKRDAGVWGDPFGYELETDAMRWEALIVEKEHWLQQLAAARD